MNTTILFIIIICVSMALFDVWIIWKKGKSESISAHVIRASEKYPLAVFLVGMLFGHFFWNMPTENVYKNVECKEVKK